MKARTCFTASALLALLCAVAAQAQQHSPMFVAGRAQGAPSLSGEQKQERHFLRETAAHVRFQRQASALALEKSTNDRVRNVAATLLEHANTVQPEVQYMLHARGMAMPMTGSDEGRVLRQLQKLSGTKFDRMYLEEAALKASQLDVARYERIAAVTRDQRLQAWVERQLPVSRYHAGLAARPVPGGDAPALGRPTAPIPAGILGAGPSMVLKPPPRVPPPKV